MQILTEAQEEVLSKCQELLGEHFEDYVLTVNAEHTVDGEEVSHVTGIFSKTVHNAIGLMAVFKDVLLRSQDNDE